MGPFPHSRCSAHGRGSVTTSSGWQQDVQPLLLEDHQSVIPVLGAGLELQCSPSQGVPLAPNPWAGAREQLLDGYFHKQTCFHPQLSGFVSIRNRSLLGKKIGEGKKAPWLLLQQTHGCGRGLAEHSIYFFLSDISSLSASHYLICHPDKGPREKPSGKISNHGPLYQVCVTNAGTGSSVSFGPSEIGVPGNHMAVSKTGQRDDVTLSFIFPGPTSANTRRTQTPAGSSRFKAWTPQRAGP